MNYAIPLERASGVRWFVESDELGFEIKRLHRPEAKRGILSEWQPESSWPNVGLGEIPDENLELKKETSANCTDVNTIPESSQGKAMPEFVSLG